MTSTKLNPHPNPVTLILKHESPDIIPYLNTCNLSSCSEEFVPQRTYFVQCPLCKRSFSSHAISTHASSCSPSEDHGIEPEEPKRKRQRALDPSTESISVKQTYSKEPISDSILKEDVRPGLALMVGLAPHPHVPGLLVRSNFITEKEESVLLKEIDQGVPWLETKSRLAKSFGVRYDFSVRGWVQGNAPPLPPYAHRLVQRFNNEIGILQSFAPNQMAVNKYEKLKGHQILPHNDNANGLLGPYIVGLSIGASCTMTFTSDHSSVSKLDAHLPSRALFILSGPSHHHMRHAIFNSSLQGPCRISLTFREVLGFVSK